MQCTRKFQCGKYACRYKGQIMRRHLFMHLNHAIPLYIVSIHLLRLNMNDLKIFL